ncbi:adenosylmethionine--8-amino-7-oxononanoate transaminase [Kocuria tytonicola]|uniref:adenosylmethionine--8-amino-7-oxononanoate transaminase n=1 Tax=Kocuria tytonicola TaxID=2055946 RepID=UPI000EF8BFF6|nr:adenosylmethionine--8-amino-7-oxononanoate transaminase [Kocuria tytonicola]RLZ03525.1 adenosylmethionine--8-amino-7-oxononanoate transaminase [Kocuria tytonicola]
MPEPGTADNMPAGESLAERDRGLLWHPYEALDGPAPYTVEAAQGVALTLVTPEGERVQALDGMASWWCAVHGYRNPELDRAAVDQITEFSHVMFGGLTHRPAVELGELLVEVTPPELQHVFFADSGSVSVEVALKLAVQYQAARGRPERRRILTVRGGYHGDTTGAMSVCDPEGGMHAEFSGLVAEQLFVAPPPAAATPDGRTWESDDAAVQRWIADVRATARGHSDELAGIIVEPVLQGAGGMRTYNPRCLRVLRELADELDLVLIVDEIATGFGRTGRWFASEWADVVPDVMCVGKALTGGYMSLAAVLVSEAVGAVITDSEQRALMHGPTFMANPLACAVALQSVRMLRDTWCEDVARAERTLREILPVAADLRAVKDVRVLGAVGVIEFHHAPDPALLTRTALEQGVWFRPFGRLLYTMPPYVCTEEELRTIAYALLRAAQEVELTSTGRGAGLHGADAPSGNGMGA